MFQPPKHLLQVKKTSTPIRKQGQLGIRRSTTTVTQPQERRRTKTTTSRPESPQPLEGGEPLPFNLPPGAVPLNSNN